MRKKGFTLIELLAVIVILGILAVITIPTINGVIEKSRIGAFKASTLSLFDAYTNYEAEHGFGIKEEIPIFDLDITNKSTFESGKIYREETETIKVENVSNKVYCASGTQMDLRIVEGTCDLLDLTSPEIVNVTSDVTTNSIKIYTTYKEEESFISKHEYRIVKANENIEEASWISGDSLTENLSTKTFSHLEQGVTYKIQVRLTNTALENSVSEIYELEVSTVTLEKPVITLLTDKEYATEKEIKITYPEGTFTYEYSIEGKNWISTNENEKILTIEENKTIRARVYDGTNYVYADSLTIGGIDKTKPIVTITKNVVENKNVLTGVVEPTNTLSGYTYTWYKDGKVIEGETSNTLIAMTAGTYQLKVTTGAGVESVSNEITIHAYTITYNLNGGTGSIGSQTKIEDLPLTLTNTEPTREGYEFQGWGVTNSDKVATYTSGNIYTKNESITLYAIWKKGYTITFASNGATLSETTKSCEVYNAETSCQITTPTITRSGYSIVGYGESTSSKTSIVGSNATLTVSGNKTYYAVTSKVFTANFNKNTVSSISATSSSCTIYNTEVSCTPILPTITVQPNFTNRGWGTTPGQTSAGVTSITLNASNSGSTWYALNSRTLTWNFNKNTVSSISKASDSCIIWSTSGTCTITTPTITDQSNFTQKGFGTAGGSTSATIAAGASMTLNNSTTGGTYYALNSRVLSWNFNKNTVSAISRTSDSCIIWSTSGTCTITTPTITAQTNFTQKGFGTAGGSTSATIAAGASMTLNNSTTGGTYYALNSRTLSWNFNKNTVSAISKTSDSCIIWNTSGTCTITTPTITAQTNFTQQGFGTAGGSTSAVVAQNASMTLSNTTTGGTYYALNSRRLTWNFNKGSVSSISKTTDGCTIWSTGATCTISAPTITPVSGYTGNGFGTANTSTSATIAQSGTITLSNTSTGGTYYGLQKKTITIMYNGNGATGGSTASQNCTMYNASSTCAITLSGNGFTRTNYTFQGWGTGTSSVSHNAGTSYNFSNNTTLYAIWKSKITVESLVQNNPYSYYLYFKFKDNEEHLYLSNTKMGIMEHYSDDSSKRNLSIPSYYRPDSTYTTGDHYKVVNGEWVKITSNGNLNNYFTNVKGDNAKLENIDNWFNKFCYNYQITLYKNNTYGTISTYKTLNDSNCLNGPVRDSNGNKKYVGLNPNNYVSFNGELWRIIGIFDGKIKIIRNTSIGNKQWHSNKSGNNWASSSLYNYLNTTYYNGLSATYKAMVENATWNIGGYSTSDITTSEMYKYEKTQTAMGYIGLMSTSDYGYASSECYNGSQTLFHYNNSTCTSTNWLRLGSPEWLITKGTTDQHVNFIDSSGIVYSGHTDGLLSTFAVRPTLYLKSTVKITSGSGTNSDPFIVN